MPSCTCGKHFPDRKLLEQHLAARSKESLKKQIANLQRMLTEDHKEIE